MNDKIRALLEQLDELIEEAQQGIDQVPEADRTKWSYYMLYDCKGKIRLARHLLDYAMDSLKCANRAKEAEA